jgi:general secretion pathway protein G
VGTIIAKANAMRRAARRRQAGLLLVEVLVTVAIIALISGAIGLAIHIQGQRAKERLTRTEAETVRNAVDTFWIDSPGVCPGVEQLIEAGVLKDGSPQRDPWGNAWRISCEDTKVTVATNGPDRQPETDDDIRVPQP